MANNKHTIIRNDGVGNIKLDEAFREYIHEKKINNLSEYTIIAYTNCYKKLKSFLGENIYANEVDLAAIQDWISSMLDNDMKPITINFYVRNSMTFIKWCMEEHIGYIKPFKINFLKEQEPPIKYYTEDEIKLLLARPKKKASFVVWRTWVIVNWILATGNRCSTLLNIKIQDICFTRKEIVFTRTKNKKLQIMPLSHSLEVILREYLRTWRNNAEPTDYLFCNVGNEQLQGSGLRTAFHRFAKSRNVSKTSLHGLRHTYCKLSVISGIDPFRLMKLMSHQHISTTQRYCNIFSDDLHKDFEKFNPLDNLTKSMSKKHNITRN